MGFQVNKVQKALQGADYPMNGGQLAGLAERNGARESSLRRCAAWAR